MTIHDWIPKTKFLKLKEPSSTLQPDQNFDSKRWEYNSINSSFHWVNNQHIHLTLHRTSTGLWNNEVTFKRQYTKMLETSSPNFPFMWRKQEQWQVNHIKKLWYFWECENWWLLWESPCLLAIHSEIFTS